MSGQRREGEARSASQLMEDPGVAQGTIETPTIEKEEATKGEMQAPWNVVVHNDLVNVMTYVTMVFQRIFGYPRERAEKHMLEEHQKGRSILWSGDGESAGH